MGIRTNIPWCHHTFNGWRGCREVSPGCDNCYARAWSFRNPKTLGTWGPEGQGTRIVAAEAGWGAIQKWDREAEATGERHRVFCFSLADVFERWTGSMLDSQERQLFLAAPGDWWTTKPNSTPLTMDHVRQRLFGLITKFPYLDFLLTTKRPENVLGMVPASWRYEFPPNIWVLVSVENQEAADTRLPHLAKIPARVRGLSMEPLLDCVDLDAFQKGSCIECGGAGEGSGYDGGGPASSGDDGMVPCDACRGTGIDESNPGFNWVIIGGESTQKSVPGRPFNVAWAQRILSFCESVNVPVFMKQLGSRPFDDVMLGHRYDDHTAIKVRDSHGADLSEWPESLRVREFPIVEDYR